MAPGNGAVSVPSFDGGVGAAKPTGLAVPPVSVLQQQVWGLGGLQTRLLRLGIWSQGQHDGLWAAGEGPLG